MTGKTEGPVARVKSIKILLLVAAYKDMAVFKVDIGLAFMRTPMVEGLKHKQVHLDKLVVKILQELRSGEFEPYRSSDDTMIMEMTKINYNLVEANHYQHKHLKGMFEGSNHETRKKDMCVFIKKEGNNVAFFAISVDDCCLVTMKNLEWIYNGFCEIINKNR